MLTLRYTTEGHSYRKATGLLESTSRDISVIHLALECMAKVLQLGSRARAVYNDAMATTPVCRNRVKCWPAMRRVCPLCLATPFATRPSVRPSLRPSLCQSVVVSGNPPHVAACRVRATATSLKCPFNYSMVDARDLSDQECQKTKGRRIGIPSHSFAAVFK